MATVTVTTTATATPPSTPPLSRPTPPGHSISTAAIIAISVILALLTLFLIAFGIWFVCIRKRKRRPARPSPGDQASALAYDDLHRRGVGPGQIYPLRTGAGAGAGRTKAAGMATGTEQQDRGDRQQAQSSRQRAASLNSDISGDSIDYDDGAGGSGRVVRGGGTGGAVGSAGGAGGAGGMGGTGGIGRDAARQQQQSPQQHGTVEHYAPPNSKSGSEQQRQQQGKQAWQPAREHFAPSG